jgi:hypothetical protein
MVNVLPQALPGAKIRRAGLFSEPSLFTTLISTMPILS